MTAYAESGEGRVEAHGAGQGAGQGDAAIEGRSPRALAWRRLRRDRVALAGAVFVGFLLTVAVLGPVLTPQDPNELHTDLLDGTLGGLPEGALGGVSTEHWLGVEPVTGRDLFARVVHGARTSLVIALPATLLALLVGAVVGVVAGYFRGRVDAVLSRVTDVLLGFPVVLFAIALIAVADDVNRLVMLVAVLAGFGWPFIARVVRGQTLSLRERDFVDAARSLGAGDLHVLFRQLLPNLTSSLLVLGTLLMPVNVLSEAALSFLGVGVEIPTASWGQTLADAARWATADPFFMVVPGTALFLTVLAFNLLGDGLRDALDPRSLR